MKKIFSFILTIIIIISCFSCLTFGEYYGSSSGWDFTEEGIITHCNIDKVMKEENGRYKIVIPYSVAGIKIVGLGDEWLQLEYDDMQKTDIYIPSTITSMTEFSLHNGPITYMSEHPQYFVVKGSYADKYISDINKDNASIGDAYRIKYVDSVEKLELEDEDIAFSLNYAKEMKALSEKNITKIDVDLKEAFINKINEHKKSRYFLFDVDNDNIPELFIVNIDEEGNLIDSEYTHTVKDRGETYEENVAYEKYEYYYKNVDDIIPELGSKKFSFNKGKEHYSYCGGFYSTHCNGVDILIIKSFASDNVSFDYDIVNKYYNSPLIYVNNYNKEETRYQYISNTNFKKYLNGERLEYGIQYADNNYSEEDMAYEKEIIDYATKIEKNPVKTYATTDLTGIENWDFSNIKVNTSNVKTEDISNNITPNDITVILNEQKLDFAQPPVIENGTTLVPMRAIFEAMGASVEWNGETKSITAVKDDITINLTLNETKAAVNNNEITLAVPAKLVNNSTMVPLRFISESLGAEVNWDGESRTITINE